MVAAVLPLQNVSWSYILCSYLGYTFLTSVSLVTQLCLTLCCLMDWSTPGFPVHHQPLELLQTHVHLVSDAIQPSHPLLSSTPPAFNLSQHQVFFTSGTLGLQLQHQSFQWIFRTDFLIGLTSLISLQSKRFSRVS